MWKKGSTPITMLSSVQKFASRTWHRFATRLRWVSITPLGRPVVPEEYGSTATSSGSISGEGASAGSPSRSVNGAAPSASPST